MLKIALPTFKSDENHTQNSKIHIQNSVCEVRCGECGGGFLYFGCQGGEMVVRLRHVLSWLRRFLCVIQAFARFICGENAVLKWRNGGAITAVAWCVSGVSNHDFPNFTKHSTVLTSILQQISILYQHFPSAKTAIPALKQAKTMLKIALPTFKNDENYTQNSKIHIQNSGYEVRCGENAVRCGENAVLKWRNVCGVRRFHD